ncbi:nucleotidyl transferase AbiEii/AbiGii toxin family protein [Fibrisoma montanum]|uniref:Nucleotidyl transferase AbiEii/AbiGii toxin family protein n=1 Tax=Fibrisoma montanum TaxID=2305895 RepID=A0A418MIX4_9BACT|nr:nucleotidyl transferase AbiEii/AbiGii toxin family protein [Fibrisoma montanum]RIV27357.1 nucleotidyl transferase AbiEii/AbiGii toxin family protein [Fibrisoma montanum]
MLDFSQIITQYPLSLQPFSRFILREYLQYKLLQLIYDSDYADRLVFLGGTCLRIVHGNQRFSEDLDFDNTGINETDFTGLASVIENGLRLEGYEVEMRLVMKGAYHCHVKFPALLFQQGLSGYREEKILIQLDTEPQYFAFTPEPYLLNRFDVFTQINTTPVDLLLAQKFYAILNRVRNKGRDFYDAVFLLGKGIKPNYDYLQQKLQIDNAEALRSRLLDHCRTIDMQAMAADVRPFLFNAADERRVALFEQYIRQVRL